MTSSSFTLPSLSELEKVQADLMSILTLLPNEIRHGIDTSGTAEKFAQPTKKVKFSSESTPVVHDEVKSRVLAKISELRGKRGGIKKSEKPAPEKKKTTPKNKPSKVDSNEGAGSSQKVVAKKPASKNPSQEVSKMIFSNIDTKSEDHLVLEKQESMKKKKTTDPAQLLQKAMKRKEKLENIKAKADNPEKIEVDLSMKAALAKARGEKLVDDVKLLKSAVKSREKRKEKSRKEWGKRVKMVEKHKVAKIKKRSENIAKRKAKK